MDEKAMNQEALKKEEEKVLCGANSYREQYFFNPRFSLLPKEVQESLQKITVTYTEEIGGVFLMQFGEEGRLELISIAEEIRSFFPSWKSTTPDCRIWRRSKRSLCNASKY